MTKQNICFNLFLPQRFLASALKMATTTTALHSVSAKRINIERQPATRIWEAREPSQALQTCSVITSPGWLALIGVRQNCFWMKLNVSVGKQGSLISISFPLATAVNRECVTGFFFPMKAINRFIANNQALIALINPVINVQNYSLLVVDTQLCSNSPYATLIKATFPHTHSVTNNNTCYNNITTAVCTGEGMHVLAFMPFSNEEVWTLLV